MRMSSLPESAKSEHSDRGLIVFARYPTVGTVKTRLAAGVGAHAATELYKSFVSGILTESLRFSFKPKS